MSDAFNARVATARIFLLDGPLMQAPERREALVSRMATDLIRYEVTDRSDAVPLLRSLGYSATEIHCVIEDAWQVAVQETLVAREMSQP